MNDKNIMSLKTRLIQLGFEPSVETMLRCNICFQPSGFDLLHDRKVGADRFLFSVRIEFVEKEYDLRFYMATMRKQVFVPLDLSQINELMGAVDWNRLVQGRAVQGSLENENVNQAFDVLQQISSIGSSANILKFKYWIGTGLESMIPQLSAFKAEWEISEKFYFFDDVSMINFEDAIRFLSSKWVEKKVAASKKLLVKKNPASRGDSVATGKLLGKSQRRLTRRSNNNSPG